MNNLICRYIDKPTLKNAQAIRAYERKHPMCRCLLSDAFRDMIANAIRHANSGKPNLAVE